MNHLIEVINNVLDRDVTIYYEKAPQNITYPYAVFVLTNAEADFDKDDYMLEIDVFDNKGNAVALDCLCDKIVSKIDRYKIHTNEVQTCIYRVNRLVLPQTEEIKRRQLRFICKTYTGGLT